MSQPDEAKLDAIARTLEKFLGRPLVNESRRELGLPTLDDESPVVQSHRAPNPREFSQVVTTMQGWSPEWIQEAVRIVRGFEPGVRPRAYGALKG